MTTLSKAPVNIVIDLVAMLPAGANGGAKWLAIGVVKGLIALLPSWRFFILVNSSTYDEVARLFPRADLICVIDSQGQHKDRLQLPMLPGGKTAHVLFCPFISPFIQEGGAPVVSLVHDIQFDFYPEFMHPDDADQRYENIIHAMEVSDRIVAISSYVRQTLVDYGKYPADNIITIPIALADRLAPPTSNDVLTDLNTQAGRYLLYPANTWPHKNHAMLLTAFAMYRAKHPESDMKLVCCGVNSHAGGSAIKKAVRIMGLEGAAIFPGFLSEEDLSSLFSNSLAMIFPSLYEGFGMPVMEAMANNTAVLCSNMTSLPEVAGDCAIYFDPRNPKDILSAIETAESSPDLLAELKEKGRRRAAEAGGAREMAESYRDVIIEAMTDRGYTADALPDMSPLYSLGQLIDFADPEQSLLFFREGWADPDKKGIWALNEQSTLELNAGKTQLPLKLVTTLLPFIALPEIPRQPVAFFVNSIHVGTLELDQERDIEIDVSADAWNAHSPVMVTMIHPKCRSPQSLGLSDDGRRLSVFVKKLGFVPTG